MATPTTVLSQPRAAKRFLLPILRRSYPGTTDISRLVVEPLGSVQRGRGVFHITAQLHGRTTKMVDLYGNYDVRGGSQAIYRFLKQLSTHGFTAGRYRAPRPLAYSTRYKILIYESFEGRRVRDELEAGKLSAAALRRVVVDVAGWLKKFHALPPRIGEKRTMTLSAIRFSHLTKSHRDLLNKAFGPMNAAIRSDQLLSLVHGDPHLANCIRRPGALALIDYSESYIGHPLADVAMFLVHLDVALKNFFSRQQISEIQRAFVIAYCGRTVDAIPMKQLQLLVAFEVRTAAVFLRFTSDHHRNPSPFVRWMINRFETVIASGTASLQSDRPWPLFSQT